MHVQIKKERNSPVKSSLKYVQLINATAALSLRRSKYFFSFRFLSHNRRSSIQVGKVWVLQKHEYIHNQYESFFFVLSFTAMYSEDVLGISSARMSFKHIENDFLYSHIHIYNIYFYNTNSQLQ